MNVCINLRINFVDLFLIHLDYVLPLHFQGGAYLAAGDTEVPGDNHPLLDLLSIAHSFLVGGVNTSLDSFHDLGIWTL